MSRVRAAACRGASFLVRSPALPVVLFLLGACALAAPGLLAASGGPPQPRGGNTVGVSATADRAPPAATDLFLRRCARCHGEDGSGSGRRAGVAGFPDFSDRRWQNQHTDAQLLVSILDGKGSGMPAFRGRFSEDQARDLVVAVRALGPAPAGRRADPAADDFEKRFGQLQREFEELRRQYRELSAGGGKP